MVESTTHSVGELQSKVEQMYTRGLDEGRERSQLQEQHLKSKQITDREGKYLETICDPLWEKVHFRAKTKKFDLLASKESAKLALSNDVIIALVYTAASVFAR